MYIGVVEVQNSTKRDRPKMNKKILQKNISLLLVVSVINGENVRHTFLAKFLSKQK
jgi:hypothetical protein